MKNKFIQFMRRSVNSLPDHPLSQAMFFAGGFFTLRLVFPLQYLLLRELINCKSILDLGCGRHSMVPILPQPIHKVGVELFKPHFEEARASNRHNEYINEDILKVCFPEKSFDAVVLLDVLEHLSKEDGEALMNKIEKWARNKVVIFTPNGYLHQDHYDENPLMEHKSGWTTSEFKQKGYRVHGVRGFKDLKDGEEEHDHGTGASFKDTLVDLTQVITYHIPDQAFQLFCVKDIK